MGIIYVTNGRIYTQRASDAVQNETGRRNNCMDLYVASARTLHGGVDKGRS